MDALAIINKYYPEDNELKHILLAHSRSVADKALWIAGKHPELNLDKQFLEEAAMLHDIGIFMTDAEGICCFGSYPYICHGYLGADLMRKEGFPRHALVCERHTGAGMSLQSIIDQQLPVPHRNMVPVSLEEQVICFADKFFSYINSIFSHLLQWNLLAIQILIKQSLIKIRMRMTSQDNINITSIKNQSFIRIRFSLPP